MGWIKFDFDVGNALIWYDTASEDGWVFDFDSVNKNFRLWEYGENHFYRPNDPDYVCENLNDVCSKVKAFK